MSPSPRRPRRPAEIALAAVAVVTIAALFFGAVDARSGSNADVESATDSSPAVAAEVPSSAVPVPAADATELTARDASIVTDAPMIAAPDEAGPTPTTASRTLAGTSSSAPDAWTALSDLTDAPGVVVDHRIEIDSAAVRQSWDGVGAALTDASATLLAAWPDAIGRLFDEPTDDGAGLDLVRLPLSATDFSTDDWTWERTGAGTLEPAAEAEAALDVLGAIAAVQPDVEVVAAAWTAPTTFRTQPADRGGSLRHDAVDAYGSFLIDQVNELIERGVAVKAISLGNEPGHVGDYPTLGMTDDQMLALADRVAPSLDDADVDLLALDHNWSDAERAAYLVEHGPFDAAAFHCYDGDPAAMSLVSAAIVTECTATTGEWRTSVGWMARELVGESIRAGSTGLLTWNLALDSAHGPKAPGGCDDCRGLVTVDPAAGTVEPTPEFAVMRHLSAAADPAASVVATPQIDDLPLAAFVNPDGTVGLFGHNDSAETITIDVVVDGAAGRFEIEPWSVFSLRG